MNDEAEENVDDVDRDAVEFERLFWSVLVERIVQASESRDDECGGSTGSKGMFDCGGCSGGGGGGGGGDTISDDVNSKELFGDKLL